MRILISNDDGATAPGLAALYAALQDYAECVVVAPDQDKSGASSSLTLDRPLHPQVLANGFISVNGTPTDCVHLAINSLLDQEPDLVVSGINLGANLGDDVLYSGTVAAALEDASLAAPRLRFRWHRGNWTTCPPRPISRASWWRPMAPWTCRRARCLNVNIPNFAPRPHSRYPAYAPGPSRPCGSAVEGRRPAWQGRLLDRGSGRCRRRWPRHGLSRGDARLCVDYPVAT